MYAFWNNKKYKIINSIEINKSSREVTFSDLTLDFSKCTLEDLPYAQQEVKIYDKNDNLKFTGFVSDYKLPELKKVVTPKKEFSLSLYSPRQLATKRTITIIRTATLTEVINQALSPLFSDGFTLNEINVPDVTITVKLISRTVEETLNYLSNKYSLYWNIDEFKNITINSIEYQFNKPVIKSININNYKQEINGMLSITPSVENIDYGNIINVKNARIFYEHIDSNSVNITLSKGDRIDFENPVDISLGTAERIAGELVNQGVSTAITNLQIDYNNSKAYIICGFNTSGEIEEGRNIKNIATDDSTGALFVLTMDSMFSNLATGVTYKGEGTVTVKGISGQAFLRYANMRLINWYEIEQYAGKITPSGQIEKVLDVEEGWFTVSELIDYVRSKFTVNNKYTNQVNIKYDKENDITVGDRIEINLPEYFTVGNYIVTGITESTEGTNPTQYNLELRNTNLLENFIDLFRSSSDIEEQESQVEMEYVVEYAEEEAIQEIHEVEFANADNHTLNFNL